MLPAARVVKAFNTIFADVRQPERILRDGQWITAFFCGDDDAAKAEVIELIPGCGFAPLDCGPLRVARFLEAMARLNIRIAVGQGGGTNAAFLYHQVRS